MTITNFSFSKNLKILFKALLNQGDELRLVGGCVRDFLISKEVSDIDLACKYLPEKTIRLLKKNNIKVIPTGIKHGTVTAFMDGESFEITTLRKDVETYGRKAKVEFVDDFYLDAKRRDFTINAMSIDFSGKLYDYFDGYNDLKNGVIKFIGHAQDRVKEDYLRILRFFRFSCYYSNSLDYEGLKASISLKNHIKELSVERVRDELIKIIDCPKEENLLKVLDLMQENNISIAANFNLQYLKNLFFLEKQINQKFDYLFKFAVLVFDLKDKALPIIDGLRFSNRQKKYVTSLISPDLDIDFNISENQLLELLFDHNRELIINSFAVKLISSIKLASVNNEDIKKFLVIKNILENKKIPNFIINGNDLLQIGIPPLKIGKLIRKGKSFWMENNFAISKEEILDFIKSQHKD